MGLIAALNFTEGIDSNQIKPTINMQAFLLTTLAAVAMAQPDTGYGAHHPAPYGHPAPYRHRRAAESEAAPEAKPLVPLVGLKHNLVYPAFPALAHPYAHLGYAHPGYAHPYALPALAHPYALPLAPVVAPQVVVAPAAPAPNDPTAPAAWTASHPAGLAHESVAGGLRTNHGDGTSYVFQSNLV